MIPFVNLPVKIVKLFTSNVSPKEIAAGVCMGMFLGFVPLNGFMALFLLILMFVFKINRLSSLLMLPIFKLLYLLFVSALADTVGGIVLLDLKFLAGFWKTLTTLPVFAYLDFGNTLVAGGLVISAVLFVPVFMGAEKGIVILREKYFDKFKESKIAKWFMKLPIVTQIAAIAGKVNQ